MSTNPFEHDTYELRRKILRIFGGAFYVYDPDGQLAFFSEQKSFKLREDIRLYADLDQAIELLTIQARSIIDFSAAYDVVDTVDNERVGTLRRRGFKSMFRDEWEILDADEQPLGRIIEDSMTMALLRRALTNLVPQKFRIECHGRTVGTLRQNFNLFAPRIRIDFSMDPDHSLDRRLGLAAAILICAVEGRQAD